MVQRVWSEGTVRLDRALQDLSLQHDDSLLNAEVAALRQTLAPENALSETIDPPTVIGAVYAHIMPHLRNPAVLLPSRRQELLRRLEEQASSRSSSAPVVPGGLETLRHELAALEQLLKASNSLIGG
ncbi:MULTISPECIES: hypothetical protein [Gluconobacter]|uniref:Uncharacterized protein n=1 Tax=Gluconobacter cadivus TaxID=2728101 RepID=A0ABR9YVN9_9PROT|nr:MULTISPECIES: hypothetical protein [Gluconobacter]MBF0888615.1 hypothetical protein [Gluconobacter cadivus]MBS1060046.1 hypothetical protein [Gluconobacter sp. Dm-44]MBS1066580.1 hypothetical protein [Gluconobacter kondonii]MBS1080540.1 hypothetical protein [Gluconobacter kondonii]MBS1083282.1 hypothetical protein [Gluconobacter kondonii]